MMNTNGKPMSLLSIRNLQTHYLTRQGPVYAVSDLGLELNERDFLGIVGESGCGKSTLAYSIMKLIPEPGKIVGGNILFKENDLVKLNEREMSQIRWNDISMIFQQSMNSLNPVQKVKDQIIEAIMLHKIVESKKQALEIVEDLFLQVGLGSNVIDSYPFELSGGMKQRVIIAMALSCNPKIVIADEPTTALDVTIKAQIMDLLKKIRHKYKMSLIMISHDLSVIAETCDKVIVMYAGKIIETGDVVQIFNKPGHPYTKLLIGAIPSMESVKRKKLISIPGKPPNLLYPIRGCGFFSRCPFAKEICENTYPNIETYGNIACHFADDFKDISIYDYLGE